MRKLLMAVFVVSLALAGSGCCCLRGLDPCVGPRCDYSCGNPGCGIRSCGGSGGIVDSCGDCGHDPCTCGGPVEECQTCAVPSFSLCGGNLLNALFGCTGCDGEFYWSEWFSDPPACCDPCDDHGYYTGYGGPVVPEGYVPSVAEAPGCACGMH